MSASPPSVDPTPFSIVATNLDGSIPNNKPVKIATINNDKKGLTFFTVKKICTEMAITRIKKIIAFF